MLERFISNISKNRLFTKQDKLLVAFSGGIDSVVLGSLLKQSGFDFDLAHCNFQLRGKESEDDERFCIETAKKLGVKIHCIRFDTRKFMEEQKLSVQMAARKLRYDWFEKLLKEEHYTYVLTAHHLNDSTETLLVNLTRGTGISGLQGIPMKQKHIVRPMLFALKEEITEFAKKSNLAYRNDSSNDEVKYKRNFLRHAVIPELKKLNPALEHTFENNIKLFKQAATIVKAYCDQKRKEITKEQEGMFVIFTDKLLQEASPELLLFEWLSPFGFNSDQCSRLFESLEIKTSGKRFISESHRALIDRNSIIVESIELKETKIEYTINSPDEFNSVPFDLEWKIVTETSIDPEKGTAQLDLEKLEFPLTIRKWKKGDKFKPLGMTGFKKLSDFFTGIKLTVFEKEKVWLLCSGNEIVWVIGLRIDDRFKVTASTKRILNLKLVS